MRARQWAGLIAAAATVYTVVAVVAVTRQPMYRAGISMTLLEDGYAIHTVVPQSPAWDAGIRSGDRIVRLNGFDAPDLFALAERDEAAYIDLASRIYAADGSLTLAIDGGSDIVLTLDRPPFLRAFRAVNRTAITNLFVGWIMMLSGAWFLASRRIASIPRHHVAPVVAFSLSAGVAVGASFFHTAWAAIRAAAVVATVVLLAAMTRDIAHAASIALIALGLVIVEPVLSGPVRHRVFAYRRHLAELRQEVLADLRLSLLGARTVASLSAVGADALERAFHPAWLVVTERGAATRVHGRVPEDDGTEPATAGDASGNQPRRLGNGGLRIDVDDVSLAFGGNDAVDVWLPADLAFCRDVATALGTARAAVVAHEQIDSLSADLRSAVDHRDDLLHEVYHRVKNNLQLIASIVSLQLSGVHEPAVAGELDRVRRRVRSISLVHDACYRVDGGGATSLEEIVEQVCSLSDLHRANPIPQLTIATDGLRVGASIGVGLALIVNEFASNCRAHAPTCTAVSISAVVADSSMVLEMWHDGPGIEPPRDGLGITLMRALAQQVGGTILFAWEPHPSVRVTMPASRVSRRSVEGY